MPKYFPGVAGLVRARDILPNPDRFRDYPSVADYPADATAMLLCGRKKDETKGWELLPTRPLVDRVLLYQPCEKHLAWVARMPGVRRLGMLNPKATDYAALAQMRSLEALFIEDAARLESLDFLGELHNLRAFSVFDAQRLNDLSGLEGLTQLKELAIQRGVWNALKVRTLKPLAGLKSLTDLVLLAQSDDPSREPLRHLSALASLQLNLECPFEELAKLAAFFPQSLCSYFAEPYETAAGICRRDKSHTTILPAAGRRRFCRDCSPEKLDEYLTEFRHIRDETRSRGAW
jgi:hypothetical protein